MGSLVWVLRVKIFCTVVFWALPLLFCPTSWFVWVGMPEPRPMVFVRLLGAAYAALVVGYVSGLIRLRRGKDARNTVWVGITSNGSASLILFYFGITGAWEGWGIWAWISMWISALLTASITLALVVAGLFGGDR